MDNLSAIMEGIIIYVSHVDRAYISYEVWLWNQRNEEFDFYCQLISIL